MSKVAARLRGCSLSISLAAAASVVPIAARAQTIVIPILPPEDVVAPAPVVGPDGKAVLPDVVAQPTTRDWEYDVGAGLGWDGNIQFAQPDGPSSMVIVPRADVGRVFAGPRGQLRLLGGGSWAGYPEESDLNRYYANVRLDGEHRSGPRTTWHFDTAYGWGYSDASPILLHQGVPLPLTKMRWLDGTAKFNQQLSDRITLRIEGRFYQATFEDPALTNGSSLRGTLNLDRKLNAKNTVGIVYAPETVMAEEPVGSYLTHYGSLQWTRYLSPRSALLLEAGASYTPNAAAAGLPNQQAFFGGATYTRQIAGSAVTFLVRREVTPAFGFAISILETRGNVRVDVPIAKDWRLQLEGAYSRPDNIEEAAAIGRPPYTDVFWLLARRFGKHVEVSAESRYRNRGETAALGAIGAFQAGVFVSVTPVGGSRLPQRGRF